MFYQKRAFFTGNNVRVLIPKFACSTYQALFIATCLNKALAHLQWGVNCSLQDIKQITFSLPFVGDEIAFGLMESYVKRLREDYVKRLRAFEQI